MIRLYKAFFILSLIFGILGLGILIIFLCNDNKCLRIVYAIIWNLTMFVMLIIILETASLGVLAYLAKDGVCVIDYIISKSNLDNVEPLVFGNTADEFSKNMIEICANEDGNYTKVIGANTISSKYIEWKRSKLNIITLSKLIHVIMILKKQLI